MAHVSKYRANLDLLAELQDVALEDEIQTQLDSAVKDALAQIS
jgi:hypothetical protein